VVVDTKKKNVAVAVDKPHHPLPPYTADCQLSTTQNDRNDTLYTAIPLPHCHCHSLSHYHCQTATAKQPLPPTATQPHPPQWQCQSTPIVNLPPLKMTAMTRSTQPSHCHTATATRYATTTAKQQKKNSHSHPPALALVVEPVDPVDARALVVPAQKEKVLGILDLVPANPG
jgi:hypothetical protein